MTFYDFFHINFISRPKLMNFGRNLSRDITHSTAVLTVQALQSYTCICVSFNKFR